MKSFLKYVLATMVGMVLIGIIAAIVYVGAVVALLSGNGPTNVQENSVLVIDLSGTICERTRENPLRFLNRGTADAQGLDHLLAAIRTAKENDKVRAIYIEAGTLSGCAPALLEELHAALEDFKSSGKPIIAYGNTYTQGAYYLCSLADSLVINPEGDIMWMGLSGSVYYYKDLLERIGVQMQVFKVGTYKSAVEPFLLNEMSDANREQITTYQSEVWARIRDAVARSRGISCERLDQLADSVTLFRGTELYLREGLVDKMAFSDEVPQLIANTLGMDDSEDYCTVSVEELADLASSAPKNLSGESIAVYYAVGNIVDERTEMFSMDDEIVADDVVDDLLRLANDDDIKAVVLRVNSPGGSAFASEQIAHAVASLGAQKPVVVSMGEYAASGGYYISALADWIVAEPTTLTGSIGIFGLFPNAEELIDKKIGIHTSTVKTHAMSDFGDPTRSFTDEEGALLQGYINRGYELFTRRCAEGRHLPQDSVKVIGEGRVWTGEHALSIGLVDQLGGLDEAIAVAKERAGVEDGNVLHYPEQPSFWDSLLDMADEHRDTYADSRLQQAFGPYYEHVKTAWQLSRRQGVQTALPYHIEFNL